jgi:nucleoid-associated protein YgaU
MALEKLSIRREDADGEDDLIRVMFNPNTYSISKSVQWNATTDVRTNAPALTFGGGGARELSLELFFDVTESTDEDPDVRDETDDIVRLTRIMRDKSKPRPPICTVDWGGATTEDFPFKGLVSSLAQRFTLFHESGRPLRATLTVTFTEFLSRTDDLLETDPELTTRTVRRGDTLASIAWEVYRDPAAWRVIAVANGITDPFRVLPGTKLTLPKQ